MAGGDRDRFCTACNRTVHDLSTLTRRQAADLYDQNAGKLCGRIHYDERGQQIFARERGPFERLLQISLLGASAAVSAAAASPCAVKVQVLDPSGAVIPQAAVSIAKAGMDEAVSSGTADGLGKFDGQIDPGSYTLEVKSPGFVHFQQDLSCKTSETVAVKAPLRREFMGEIVMVKPDPFSLVKKLGSLFRRL
jgi:hypothetical protein